MRRSLVDAAVIRLRGVLEQTAHICAGSDDWWHELEMGIEMVERAAAEDARKEQAERRRLRYAASRRRNAARARARPWSRRAAHRMLLPPLPVDVVKPVTTDTHTLLYAMASHILNEDNLPPTQWGLAGIQLLIQLQDIDPVEYQRMVKGKRQGNGQGRSSG